MLSSLRIGKFKRIRELIFQWHRYLGLVLGILIAIASLTASMTIVLADTWEIRTLGKIEPIVPQTEQLSLGALASLAEFAYGNQGEFQPLGLALTILFITGCYRRRHTTKTQTTRKLIER
ncbi:hypothetical protein IQ238_06085 [Pleurocapsales cyanobacterium LEGE 06147]|nr:hypothetical protein [Pleurocapsales cyanobacterium LEGE 06147]